MDVFFQVIFSYPVSVFSVLFILVLIYWLVSALGFIDLGSTDAGVEVDVSGPEVDVSGPDIEADLDAGGDADPGAGSSAGLFSGILLKFGLYGIPLTIILSFVIIIGWFLSSIITQFWLLPMEAGFVRYAAGTGSLLFCLIASAWLTGRLISPLRGFLDKRKEDTSSKSLCGRPATVRSGMVGESGGQVECMKDGYTYILQVQALPGDKELKKGDTVYILEYHPSANSYTVVSESKFKGL